MIAMSLGGNEAGASLELLKEQAIMEVSKVDVKNTKESGDGSSAFKTAAKIASLATASGAAIAFLVAVSVAPNTGKLSSSLAYSTSAVAAEAASPAAATMPSFADLVERVKPAVVSIYLRSEEKVPLTSWDGNQNGNGGHNGQQGPFSFFFGQGGNQQFNFPNPNMQQSPQVVRAQGSGFFITGDGYLVTNNHVVKNAEKVEIKTTSGETYKAKVIGTDPKTGDIAHDSKIFYVDGDGQVVATLEGVEDDIPSFLGKVAPARSGTGG